MAEALFDAVKGERAFASQGVGLAANQIGIPLRALVYLEVPARHWRLLVNPVILDRSERHTFKVEQCGSLPGVAVAVWRPDEIRVAAEGVEQKFIGFEARTICHEIDHLDGILITDYGLSAT